MTTIAYNHQDRQISWDGRATRDGVSTDTNIQKKIVKDGVTFFITGVFSDQSKMVDYYFGGRHEFIPECNCFAVDDGKIFYCGVTENHELWKEEVTTNQAIGSGWKFALAAMDFGQSAKDAVKYASTRCIYTGGRIRVFNIE